MKMRIFLILTLVLILFIGNVKNEESKVEDKVDTSENHQEENEGEIDTENYPEDESEDNLEEIEDLGDYEDEENENSVDQQEEFEKQVKEAMNKMELDKAEKIKKDEFRNLFIRVILQDEQLSEQEMHFFNQLVEKVVANVPEEFPTSEIMRYMDMNNITMYLNEAMAEQGYDPSTDEEMQSYEEEEMEAKDDL